MPKPLLHRPQLRAGRRRAAPHVSPNWRASPTRVCAYPNAGLPNAFGEYDETPEHMAAQIERVRRAGFVNIVGGCCGTTPDHIRAIARVGAGTSAAAPARARTALPLSGLEPLNIGDDSLFVNVGERTNVTGSAKFRKLIKAGDYAPRSTSPASRSRTARRSSTSTWTRACSTRSGDGAFLNLIAAEPDIAACR
jgi:5-methyltetrahydrofolate--homocysteine methyltransferase